MQDSRYKAYEWKSHKEFYQEENGKIVFRADTPKEILASYALYQKQIERLNNFPKERSKGFFSMFEKQDVSKSNTICIAKSVMEARFLRQPVQKSYFDSSFIFIDSQKQLYSILPESQASSPVLGSVLSSKSQVSILWSDGASDFVTVFWFDEHARIKKIQEFCSCSDLHL